LNTGQQSRIGGKASVHFPVTSDEFAAHIF
jgi:hypothetical protein